MCHPRSRDSWGKKVVPTINACLIMRLFFRPRQRKNRKETTTLQAIKAETMRTASAIRFKGLFRPLMHMQQTRFDKSLMKRG